MVLFNLSMRDKRIQTFLKIISLKRNVIARLEFELAYYVDAARHVSFYATKTPPGRSNSNSGKGKREDDGDEKEEE